MPGSGGEGAKDNWFVGYTPQLVGAVWLGYDHTDENHYLTTTSKAAAAVFQQLMSEALKGEPVMAFPKADGTSEKKHDEHEKNGKNEEKKSKSKKDRDKSEKKHDKKDEDRSQDHKHGKSKDKDK